MREGVCWLARRMNNDSVGRTTVSLPTPHVRDEGEGGSYQPLTFFSNWARKCSEKRGGVSIPYYVLCFLLSVLHDTNLPFPSSPSLSLSHSHSHSFTSCSSLLLPPPPSPSPRTCIRLPSPGWLSIIARFVVPSLLSVVKRPFYHSHLLTPTSSISTD